METFRWNLVIRKSINVEHEHVRNYILRIFESIRFIIQINNPGQIARETAFKSYSLWLAGRTYYKISWIRSLIHAIFYYTRSTKQKGTSSCLLIFLRTIIFLFYLFRNFPRFFLHSYHARNNNSFRKFLIFALSPNKLPSSGVCSRYHSPFLSIPYFVRS